MQELFLMSFLGHSFCSNDTKIHLNVAQEGWKGYVKVNTSEQGKRVKIDGESAEVHYGSWSTHLLVVKNSGKKVYLLLHSGKMIWLKTHGNSGKMFQIFLSKPLPYHHLQSLDLRQELQLQEPSAHLHLKEVNITWQFRSFGQIQLKEKKLYIVLVCHSQSWHKFLYLSCIFTLVVSTHSYFKLSRLIKFRFPFTIKC